MSHTHALAPSDLLPLLGTPDAPALVDVSLDDDFAADPHLIPGAFRHPHTDGATLPARLGGRRAVIVCQRGGKLSQGMAARLRWEGIAARHLEGGNHGWRALAGAPRIPAAAIPAPVDGATLWVLPTRPDAATAGAFWLVRRLVDPGARALCVDAREIDAVAARFGATPLPGPEVFAATRAHFGLDLPGLAPLGARLADIAAPTRPAHAETAGIAALWQGMARLAGGDRARLDAGGVLCDALFAHFRDAPEAAA